MIETSLVATERPGPLCFIPPVYELSHNNFIIFLYSAIDLANFEVHFQTRIPNSHWGFWLVILRKYILYSASLYFRWLTEPAHGELGGTSSNPGCIDKQWCAESPNATLLPHLAALMDSSDLCYLVRPLGYHNAPVDEKQLSTVSKREEMWFGDAMRENLSSNVNKEGEIINIVLITTQTKIWKSAFSI